MQRVLRTSFFVLIALAGACEHRLDGPTPTLMGTGSPHLVCNEQLTTPVSIAGSGFSPLPIGTATGPALDLPAIRLVPRTDLMGAAATGAAMVVPDYPDQLASLPAPMDVHVRWFSQMMMSFDVFDALMLPEGVYDIEVENENGHSARAEAAIAAVPPPVLDEIVPMAICIAQGDQMLELRGEGFLQIDGTPPDRPVVELLTGTSVIASFDVMSLGGCRRLPAPATDAQTCTSAIITIPMGAVPPGTYSVRLRNPEPAACQTTEAITVEVVPPPDLTAVMPARICTGGGSLGLVGTGFRPGATASVGTVAASSVTVDAGGMSATATFGLGLTPGTYDVTITNPEGCFDTLPAALEVVDGPIVFFVDPPVLYDGITTQITIYVSGAGTAVDAVTITPSGGGTAITLMNSFDAARGRVQAVVPAGTPAGTYDVAIEAAGCGAVLPDGLVITDMLDLTVTRVDPAFGRNDSITSVAITGTGFMAVPRVYLNPAVPTATTVATTLRSVAFVDPTRLTATVPAGLPVGLYDVIVVNPNGEVGLREDGFTVTSMAPPVIDAVLPGELDNDGPHTLSAQGSGFASPTAELRCLLPDGTMQTVAVTVDSSTATTVSMTVNTAALPAETVCVLVVTNPADGSYDEYSAISLTTPASNIAPTRETSMLGTGRRAPGVAAGRPSRQARFLYVVGGDAGTDAGALATSEYASVDPFGVLGTFADQPYDLPAPVTRAGLVTIGRYLYLVGGHDGTSALATAWRAEILDQLDAPVVTDVGARRGMGSGIGPGVWAYRVSAVFGPTDASNPGGESLPSDPLAIQLPASLPDTLLITVSWSMVPGAVGYRVYRSPTPGSAAGAEELLAELPAGTRTYEDDGGSTMTGVVALPLGAHGRWAAMPTMGTARAGVGVAVGVDPADPTVHYLYATGGRAGALLSSYEYLRITIGASGSHTVGASWTAGASAIGAAREHHGTYSVDHIAAPDAVAAGTSRVYVVGGAGAMALADASVGTVAAGGDLGAFPVVQGISPRNAGFVSLAGNGFLYLFGGGDAPIRGSAISGELCVTGCAPAGQISNWNAQGFSLVHSRYLARGALESAHIFIVGGTEDGTTALRSVETTVW